MDEILIKSIDIHQANVVGLGAEKFATGLVKQIVGINQIKIKKMYVNKNIQYNEFSESVADIIQIKYFFGILSRLFEIFFWKFFRSQQHEILVLGDLPLNTSAKQYVLCHQSLMFKSFPLFSKNFFQFFLFRIIFKLFLKKNDVVLVQSQQMMEHMHHTFGQKINIKVLSTTSSCFGWPDFKRTKRDARNNSKKRLTLFYPSAFYPHKNHHLLSLISFPKATDVLVTIPEGGLSKHNNSIKYLGKITRDEVFDLYREVDALLFLSSDESLGLPLLEAVKCNLPIVCPHAEYSKHLSSKNCFHFDLSDSTSLISAINLLQGKLNEGWWPEWDFCSEFKQSNAIDIKKIIL